MASLQQSCLTNPFKIPAHKSKPRTSNPFFIVSCKYPPNDHDQNQDKSSLRKLEKELAKLAMVTLAAGVLTLGSVGDASAAKSGGRVGGQAFRSSAPRASSPRPRVNSRTNIYVNPPVAPPSWAGTGSASGSRSTAGGGGPHFPFFAPGPAVAVGVGGGFDLLVLFIFFGAVAAVVRKFFGGSNRIDDDDY